MYVKTMITIWFQIFYIINYFNKIVYILKYNRSINLSN